MYGDKVQVKWQGGVVGVSTGVHVAQQPVAELREVGVPTRAPGPALGV